MSTLIETPYSTQAHNPKMTRKDQNGNLIRFHRDSSLPPPIRKTKMISESPSLIQPTPPPRKHVSISQSDLQGNNSTYTNSRIYSNHQHEASIDRNLPVRASYRPTSRQSHLTPNLHQRTSQTNYDGSLPCHYASQRANVNTSILGQNHNNNYYHRNLHQGQTLPIKKSPYPNYAFHIPPQSYNRYGSRSSSASYDRFGSNAFDRAYMIPTLQPMPDMVTTAERQQSDYARETPRKIMLSEGNLLTAHIETIRDNGRDNPFKPGTELSWEADLIVRLYKKGHPLSEVPVLLEKIKKQLEGKKSIADLDSTDLHMRSNLSQHEVNNNGNEAATLKNKSTTVSNDLCNVTNSDLPKVDITSSEKNNSNSVFIDDELIERIISKLDRKLDCDNGDLDNQETDTKINPKEICSGNVNGRLPPAIVNIPSKINTKMGENINSDNSTNETKFNKSSPTLDSVNKRKSTNSKTKKTKSTRVSKSNKLESNSPLDDNDYNNSHVVDVKRYNCCSIQ